MIVLCGRSVISEEADMKAEVMRENAENCLALAEKKLTNLPGCATYAWPQRGEPLQTTRIGWMARRLGD
jgi:hypothetical protein